MNRLHGILYSLLIGYACLLILMAIVALGLLRFDHLRVLSVQTGSMTPTFRPGDMVLIRPTYNVKVGQIATFRAASGQLVSHRVVAVSAPLHELTTRGDAVSKPDTPIKQSTVIGRVIMNLPHAGSVFGFLRQPIGLIIGLYVPALAIVWNEIKNLARHYGRGYYRLLSFR